MSVASRLGIGLAALALVAAVVFVAALVASRGGGDGGREVREWMARCGPKAARPPCGPGVRLGVDYEYLLYDHCGIEWALFDDRLWRTRPRPSNSGNFIPGVMRLLGNDSAEFRSGQLVVAFTPAPKRYEPRPCA